MRYGIIQITPFEFLQLGLLRRWLIDDGHNGFLRIIGVRMNYDIGSDIFLGIFGESPIGFLYDKTG
jgi:hypothetical protein